MRKDVASIVRAGWIDRDIAFVDVLNNSVLVDHERRAISIALLFVEDAIIFHNGVFEIAEQRKRDADLFGEFALARELSTLTPKTCVSLASNLAISA